MLAADFEVFKVLHDDVIKLLRGKRISNIFSFRGHRTLKLRPKFILKIYFLFNSKLNGRKVGFNTSFNFDTFTNHTGNLQSRS